MIYFKDTQSRASSETLQKSAYRKAYKQKQNQIKKSIAESNTASRMSQINTLF